MSERSTGMEKNEYPLEFYKFVADYLKHITTLATGSIVLVVTFLEKVFPSPVAKPAVMVALVAFTICVVGTTAIFTILIGFESPRHSDETPAWAQIVAVFFFSTTLVAFLVGIVALTVFGVMNLLK